VDQDAGGLDILHLDELFRDPQLGHDFGIRLQGLDLLDNVGELLQRNSLQHLGVVLLHDLEGVRGVLQAFLKQRLSKKIGLRFCPRSRCACGCGCESAFV